MSKKYLTLKDLKDQGFTLSKYDAQELHSAVSHHAQRGTDEQQVIFEGDDETIEDKVNAFKGDKNAKKALIIEKGDGGGSKNTEDDKGSSQTDQGGSEDNDHSSDDQNADAGKKEHHATKRKRLKDARLMEHSVNQADLDANPDFVTNGIKIGDIIEIPVTEDK